VEGGTLSSDALSLQISHVKTVPAHHKEEILTVQILNNTFLVTGSLDERMKVYNLRSGTQFPLIAVIEGCGEPVFALSALRIAKQCTLLLSSSFD
jgi:hypothetical protein